MGYMKMGSKRAVENARKVNHSHIINDPEVQYFLQRCEDIQERTEKLGEEGLSNVFELDENETDLPIRNVVAVDGGYSVVEVNKSFPSSQLAYFQFGALSFSLDDLDRLDEKPYLLPEDMAKFKELERIRLVLPIRHISYQQETLVNSVRRSLFEFFRKDRDGETFIATLRWFLFHEYDSPRPIYNLSICPNPTCGEKNIRIQRTALKNSQVHCPNCGEAIYLTDVFRLHEAIDEEIGAGGVLGYLTTVIETLMIVHYIRYILKQRPKALEQFLFLKDGPLGFFGQTARLHKPMRNLCNYLLDNYNLYLAGLEKSGAFVDHADLICSEKANAQGPILPRGHFLLLSNDHIYKYILPGEPSIDRPYASTSYYGGKLIYHTREGYVYVVTVPVNSDTVVLAPKLKYFTNLESILSTLRKLRCDMYQDSLVPIALVNQLVSIANRPSTVLLEKFSKAGVG